MLPKRPKTFHFRTKTGQFSGDFLRCLSWGEEGTPFPTPIPCAHPLHPDPGYANATVHAQRLNVLLFYQ